jgi:hypothetical protein
MSSDIAKRDDLILRGQIDAPPCYTCKAPATHVSDNITPAGYRSYQCARHAKAAPLWGSDPGWSYGYAPLEAERAK